MKFASFIISLALISCSTLPKIKSLKTIVVEKTSIRAISPKNENQVWFAGSGGKVGKVDFSDSSLELKTITDSKNEFRSSALVGNLFFTLNIGTPAQFFKVSTNIDYNKIVYKEEGEKVFYDSFYFSNATIGVAVGDPITNCFSLIITKNGGENWTKLTCDQLPKLVDGEAAFAASNSNIKVIDSTIYIISGGKKSRLFKSENLGETWEVFQTPIVQGETMTGAFTMDFYDKKIGFIAGGNYDKPNEKSNNKAITFNGGKTWKIVANNAFFGYTSCVQFVPNKKGKELVACGYSGVFYSKDFGKHWIQLSDENDFYTLRIQNEKTIILGGKSKMTQIQLN